MIMKETRIVFGPGDLSRFRFQCDRCKGELVQGLDDPTELPVNCPLCGEQWREPRGKVSIHNELRHILKQLLENEVSNHCKIRIMFEVDDSS